MSLADPRTGICSELVPGPGPWPMPNLVARYRATVHVPEGRLTVAGAGLSEENARGACLGEGLERYAAVVPGPPDVIASVGELTAYGRAHLRPDDLGVAAAPDPAQPLPWREAADGLLVPQAAVHGDLLGTTPPQHQYPQGSTGLAAGRSPATAAESAAAEIIERDAVARAWTSDDRLTPVTPTVLPASLRIPSERAGLEVAVHLLPVGRGPETVALVALRDRERSYVGVGAAYRPDRTLSLTKAWLEAVVAIAQAAELDAAETGPALAEQAGLRPWRADRRYASGGWTGVDDITQHAQLLLDPDLADQVWRRLRGRPAAPPAHRTWRAATALAAAGFAATATVDLAPPDLRAHGGPTVLRMLAVGAETVRPAGVTPEALPCPLI